MFKQVFGTTKSYWPEVINNETVYDGRDGTNGAAKGIIVQTPKSLNEALHPKLCGFRKVREFCFSL